MLIRFRKHGHHDGPADGKRQRLPFIFLFLMIIGLLSLLYLLVVYVLMPILAMLTVS